MQFIHTVGENMSKFDEAQGLFWGAALFIGALISLIIGFRGNMKSDWLFAILVGVCVFLAVGLVMQGVVSLFKNNSK